MRLQREEVSAHNEDPTTYKSAVKSVIRCQIQSLLQKLALETGEESIVISTNIAAGTYTHLGSYMGQEYLDDGSDECIHTICSRFSDFCAGLQIQSQTYSDQVDGDQPCTTSTNRKTLPAPNKTPRKRPLTPSKFSPPNKRKAVHYLSPENRLVQLSAEMLDSNTGSAGNQSSSHVITSPNKGSSSSHIEGDHSKQQIGLFENIQNNNQPEKKGSSSITWIKSEPIDDYSSSNGTDAAVTLDEAINTKNLAATSPSDETSSPPQSIINRRPRSLIPLANILKKYGNSQPVKAEALDEERELPSARESTVTQETLVHEMTSETLPFQDSILRSLYNQSPYGLDGSGTGSTVTNERSDSPNQLSISLPQNLQENLESFPASSENLVLAGYYDADNYPRYRHSRKHPVKKSKVISSTKEKTNSSMSLVETPVGNATNQEIRMRMFESGGRLVYACDVCKRELSHLTSYRRHMKLHTMERPHKCPVCSKGFIRKYHCIDHMNKHHKDVEFDAETLAITGANRSLYTSPVPSSNDQQALSDSYSISPSEYNYTLDQSIENMTDSGNGNGNQSLNLSIDQSASSILSELARSAARHGNQKEESKMNYPEQEMSPYKGERSSSSYGESVEMDDQSTDDRYEVTSQGNGGIVFADDIADNQSTPRSSPVSYNKEMNNGASNGKLLLEKSSSVVEEDKKKLNHDSPGVKVGNSNGGPHESKNVVPVENTGSSLDSKVENQSEFANQTATGPAAVQKDCPVSMKDGSSSMARKQEVSEGIKAIVAHLKSSSRKKKMLGAGDSDANTNKKVLEESN